MARDSVLFVCTHNSARSQMAEGLLRTRGGDRYLVCSAGTHPSHVHPLAVHAMQEVGINISMHRSEHVDVYAARPTDYVVTVCDSAQEHCPYIHAAKRHIHRSFEDPSIENNLEAFRRVRDEIDAWIRRTFSCQ